MLYDSIYTTNYSTSLEKISQVLKYLYTLSTNDLPLNPIVLIDNEVYGNIVELETRPENQCIFEAHETHIDIHYILEGIEGIALAHKEKLQRRTAYDCKKDIAFFDGSEDETLFLGPGDFIVCWPNDAHKVGIMDQTPSFVKKIVFKIKL
ncbi:YhcH/YjgK/YiaL family protein [Vallitaleaceae bacterium 9-2]